GAAPGRPARRPRVRAASGADANAASVTMAHPPAPPLPLGLALPVATMVAVVAGSNVAVRYPINEWLTWGAVTYPFAFLVTDLTNRRLGPARARQVVYVGFALAVVL